MTATNPPAPATGPLASPAATRTETDSMGPIEVPADSYLPTLYQEWAGPSLDKATGCLTTGQRALYDKQIKPKLIEVKAGQTTEVTIGSPLTLMLSSATLLHHARHYGATRSDRRRAAIEARVARIAQAVFDEPGTD